MSNIRTLGVAAVMVVVAILLTQLHLMALAGHLSAWVLAALAFGAAVIWGRIILADAHYYCQAHRYFGEGRNLPQQSCR